MKKWLSMLLCLALLLGASLPALAVGEEGEAADEAEQIAAALDGPEDELLPAGEGEGAPEEDAIGAASAGDGPAVLALDGYSGTSVTHNSRYDGYTIAKGIDVSSYQGKIDWAKVKADGVDFAIIRLGGRLSLSGNFYTDVRVEENLKNALASGVKIGAYYFSQAISAEEAREEAAEALRILGSYADDLSLPLFLDVEYVNNAGRLKDAKLSTAQQTAVALAFCEAVEDAGCDAGVYAGYLSFGISASAIASAGYQVWHAQWYTSCGLAAWYDLWQFCATGSVAGISGDVDLDYWYIKPAADPTPTPTATAPADVKPSPSPTAAPGETEAPSFTDVKPGSWYSDYVRYVVDKGLFTGMGGGLFAPNAEMTREMFVTVLYRLAGEPAVRGSSSFSDVTKTTAWYYDPVVWATENGLVNGMGGGLFGRGQNVSRQDMVTILARYVSHVGFTGGKAGSAADLTPFADAGDVNSWAKEPMQWAVANGIVSGVSSSSLSPKTSSSRAQVAAVVQRLDKLLNGT